MRSHLRNEFTALTNFTNCWLRPAHLSLTHNYPIPRYLMHGVDDRNGSIGRRHAKHFSWITSFGSFYAFRQQIHLLFLLFCLIAVVAANQQMRSTTNLLIINLALADILFVIFCVPFTATDYVLPEWPFGGVMCKLVCVVRFYCWTFFSSFYISFYVLIMRRQFLFDFWVESWIAASMLRCFTFLIASYLSFNYSDITVFAGFLLL